MTREQRKAINIPQGDNDNRNLQEQADLMSRKVEDPHFARCWFFQMRMSLQFLVLAENTEL